MINAVGREIPEEVLKATGKEPFKGVYAYDDYEYKKAAPTVRTLNDPTRSKLVENIHDALVKCGIKDGMVLSFHHHFREGDYVVNMVMEEVHRMGIKDITICASSLGKAHDPIVPYIEDGTITGIQSSGVRGKIGEAISTGRLKNLAIMRSHGGRVRAIESGEVHIDIAFIGAPTCDEYGNMRANGGKSDCGVLSYAMVDAQYADKVVAVTDCLVPFPNLPASISMVNVDYVCIVDEIGNPAKIATGAAKPTTDVRKIMMADYCTKFVVNTPYFKEGFSYQTGVGGASIASTISLGKIMEERGIHMGLGLGGITTPMCELLAKGLVNKLIDTQDFDQGAIGNVDIAQFIGCSDNIDHASSFYHNLTSVLLSSKDDLLHTVYIGSKGSHDNAVVRMLCKNRIKGLSHAALGHGKAGTGGIGTVCHHGKDALLSQLCKALQVNGIAKYRRIINLKVAGVEHNADR